MNSVQKYKHFMEDIEETEAVRAFDAAKASGETPVPYEQVLNEIERPRK